MDKLAGKNVEVPVSHMMKNSRKRKLAVFLATSGHSGVDRIMNLLLPSIASKGIQVDLLRVRGKGPHFTSRFENLNIVELGTSHSFTSLLPVVRYLKNERPDALLSDKDRVNQVALTARWIARASTRVVVRFGQMVSKMLESRDVIDRTVHYLSMRYLYRAADAVITPSNGAAADLCDFAHLPSYKVTVIPNPVDTDRLTDLAREPADHQWFNQNEIPVIAGLGELTHRKGFDTLIRAFSLLRARREAKLLIMGRGSGRSELEELVSGLGLRDDVHFAGFIENPFPYLGRASLFVQASRYEGFGMALIEALSLGVPVVATDCPSGPRDILEDGRFGSLVPVGDHHAMAGQMRATLEAPPDPQFLKKAVEPYSMDIVTDRYLQVLGLVQADPGTA